MLRCIITATKALPPVTASKSMLWVPPLVRSVCPAP